MCKEQNTKSYEIEQLVIFEEEQISIHISDSDIHTVYCPTDSFLQYNWVTGYIKQKHSLCTGQLSCYWWLFKSFYSQIWTISLLTYLWSTSVSLIVCQNSQICLFVLLLTLTFNICTRREMHRGIYVHGTSLDHDKTTVCTYMFEFILIHSPYPE